MGGVMNDAFDNAKTDKEMLEKFQKLEREKSKCLTTTYEVEVLILGRLWMPQCHAAKRQVYTVDRKEFPDGFTLDDVEEMLDHSDFSCIEDWQATYHVRRQYKGPKGIGWTAHSRSKVARNWKSEDNEWVWQDCMFPAEEME